jgi:hypothetical protein
MAHPSGKRIEKAAFVLSLCLLAFLYGFVSSVRGWFPNDLLVTAWHQASALGPSDEELPAFLWTRTYDWSGVRVPQPEAVAPGLTLISANWWSDDAWRQELRLIDVEGRMVHRWRIDPAALFSGSDSRRGGPLELHDLHGSYLFPNGDILVNVEMVGAVRMDACGTVLWTLPEGNHHSIARADDGSFWIPGVTMQEPTATPQHPEGLPGFNQPVFQDLLLRVSEDGEVLDRIHVLEAMYANGLQRYLFKNGRGPSVDPTHLNDIDILSAGLADQFPLFEAGDLVVSSRDLNLVFVLDPATGRVKWHASDPFIAQHDPDFLADGWIGVFDNNVDGRGRGETLGGSRIVAVQPHTDSVRVLYPTDRSDPFYTRLMGKWETLPNGNLLLTEALAGRVVEAAPDGSTVWEWVNEPYGEDHVAEVSKASRHPLTRADVEAWACADPQSPVGDR